MQKYNNSFICITLLGSFNTGPLKSYTKNVFNKKKNANFVACSIKKKWIAKKFLIVVSLILLNINNYFIIERQFDRQLHISFDKTFFTDFEELVCCI